MHNTQTKILREITGMLEQAEEALGNFTITLQDEHDNKSEAWQEGEKGEALRDEISELESVQAELENAIGSLGNIGSNRF